MGGRGRGRGAGGSLTYEQLQTMGIGETEANQAMALAPPPLFPKLENPPLPLRSDPAMDYMLIIKRQFIDFLHDSKSFIQPKVIRTDVERYSDKYKVLSSEGKGAHVSSVAWSHLPAELRPAHTRKAEAPRAARKRKLSKPEDIESRLKTLEEKELDEKEETGGKVDDSAAEKAGSGEEDGQDSDKEEAEDPDEEMDEGTDYVDSYFDNGEGFDDEENDSDGPVY